MAIDEMAFTPATGLKDQTAFPTTPENEAAARKQIQDVLDQIKTYLNSTLVTALSATTDSSSGADQIGATGISGISGTTVQAILESIVSLGSGSIPPDGSVSNAKLATDVKVGSLALLTTTEKANAVGAISEVKNEVVANKANYATFVDQVNNRFKIDWLFGGGIL